ncbi:MAG: glycosyltransferase family 4 protein [Elusimicrobia bacterium]|nr:glycosyltransferase family 4 protein [Elusimicrobiota bacterium]
MNDRLSVLMLTASFYPHIGGTERQALELSKSLMARGDSVMVLTRRLPGLAANERIEGVEVFRAFAPFSGFVNSLCFLFSSFWFMAARRSSYEVIHVHLASSPALAACLAGKLFKKRVVVKIGGGRGIGEIAVSSKTLSGRLKLKLLALFNPQLVAVDSCLLPELEKGGLVSLPCEVVPNGVDCEAFSPALPEDREAARHEFGIQGKSPVYVFAGRLAGEKMLGQFLEVWARSAARRAGVLLIAGDGPLEAELRARASALNLWDSAVFLGARSDIGQVYRAGDVFVLPSVAEGLSNAMLEAMACGLAVMATVEGGAANAVGAGGLLFDPRNRDEILRAIDSFAANPELCQSMGRAAREIAAKNYSMDSVTERLAVIYSQGA